MSTCIRGYNVYFMFNFPNAGLIKFTLCVYIHLNNIHVKRKKYKYIYINIYSGPLISAKWK